MTEVGIIKENKNARNRALDQEKKTALDPESDQERKFFSLIVTSVERIEITKQYTLLSSFASVHSEG